MSSPIAAARRSRTQCTGNVCRLWTGIGVCLAVSIFVLSDLLHPLSTWPSSGPPYLEKPFTHPSICHRLRRCLSGRRWRGGRCSIDNDAIFSASATHLKSVHVGVTERGEEEGKELGHVWCSVYCISSSFVCISYLISAQTSRLHGSGWPTFATLCHPLFLSNNITFAF